MAIDAGTDLDLDLRLESVSEGVLVTGTVSAPTKGQCSRCLEPITGEIEIYLTELFAFPGIADASAPAGRDQTIDIEQSIVDAVGLALPFAPVCSDDCPGLCTQCGVVLATAEPDHGHDVIDPRWAKLSGMFPDKEPPTP